MKMFDRQIFSRRSLLRGTTASLAAAGLGVLIVFQSPRGDVETGLRVRPPEKKRQSVAEAAISRDF